MRADGMLLRLPRRAAWKLPRVVTGPVHSCHIAGRTGAHTQGGHKVAPSRARLRLTTFGELTMKLRVILTALIVALSGLVGPLAVASSAAASVHHASAARHACTKKANETCIKKGQKCAKSLRGHVGWGA